MERVARGCLRIVAAAEALRDRGIGARRKPDRERSQRCRDRIDEPDRGKRRHQAGRGSRRRPPRRSARQVCQMTSAPIPPSGRARPGLLSDRGWPSDRSAGLGAGHGQVSPELGWWEAQAFSVRPGALCMIKHPHVVSFTSRAVYHRGCPHHSVGRARANTGQNKLGRPLAPNAYARAVDLARRSTSAALTLAPPI